MYRVGSGYDVHQLISGRPLIVGGVRIPFEQGLQGHSDADVLTHAIIDALFGAAALGDIGSHFPDSDPQWRDISSLKLLHNARGLLHDQGYQVVNIDSTIMAQAPKMAPYIPEMITAISGSLEVPATCVSIKATTTETLGFVGKGLGMAAQAVALIQKANG